MFEETLYQNCRDGTPFVDVLMSQGIYPGIKVGCGVGAYSTYTNLVSVLIPDYTYIYT